MALIEVYHVVASRLPIDPSDTPDIIQGSLVNLSTGGLVAICLGNTQYALGVAGDSRSSGTTSYTPESGSALSRNPKTSLTGALIGSAYGAGRTFTQNRVPDNYNEVAASAHMTVYHSGGEFWTDQYETIHSGGTTIADYLPSAPLYCSSVETAGAGDVEPNNGGKFTDQVSTLAQIVGFVLNSPTDYPSGVPGTDTGFVSALPEGGNSLSYGTFLHVKLLI